MQMSQRMKNCDCLISNRNLSDLIKWHDLMVGSMYTSFSLFLCNYYAICTKRSCDIFMKMKVIILPSKNY